MYLPEKEPGAKKKTPRADELSEKQAAQLNSRFRLISLMESGRTPRQALATLHGQYPDLNRSVRWAQKIYSRFVRDGVQGIIDGRLGNQRPETLPPDMERMVLSLWYGRKGAGPKAVWSEYKKRCIEAGEPYAGYETVKKFIASQSPADQLTRAGRINVYSKQGRPVIEINNTSYSNQRWQIDHCRLDIWVREHIGDKWLPCEVWLTAVLDVHSRSIAGFVLSIKVPDAWTNAILLRHAILPKSNPKWLNKGIPQILQPDCGSDFLSHSVASTLAYLKILLQPDPPHYPDAKGKIERWFRTLQEGCLPRLPGYMAATSKRAEVSKRYVGTLLTRRQLMQEIETWIVDEYHQTIHSKTNRKPADLWQETVRLRLPESEAELDAFLLKSDVIRTVTKHGVKFRIPGNEEAHRRGGNYWAPELTYHWKKEVRVRYNPESLESILLYCAVTNVYICEAWLMNTEDSKYGLADVIQSRTQFKIGLVARQKDYAAEIHEQDRRKVRETGWDAARDAQAEFAAEAAKLDAAAAATNAEDEAEIELMLELFDAEDMEGF